GSNHDILFCDGLADEPLTFEEAFLKVFFSIVCKRGKEFDPFVAGNVEGALYSADFFNCESNDVIAKSCQRVVCAKDVASAGETGDNPVLFTFLTVVGEQIVSHVH